MKNKRTPIPIGIGFPSSRPGANTHFPTDSSAASLKRLSDDLATRSLPTSPVSLTTKRNSTRPSTFCFSNSGGYTGGVQLFTRGSPLGAPAGGGVCARAAVENKIIAIAQARGR
nr:hypothetical protein [Ereboglobus luteus]